IRYETVEKGPNGLQPRLIQREGPTGVLMTTTDVYLHADNETRMLSVPITDTREQTARVLRAIAEERQLASDTCEPWISFQRWLEGGEHRVIVPFAARLAELTKPLAVRLRRSFTHILTLIRVHAILHQLSRDRDSQGRIIATVDDYQLARELVADLVNEAAEVTVPETICQTVDVVRRLCVWDRKESVSV